MCGIVAYFGSAGNHLTRVLTGMASIIYRGADSTGLGLFGDADEPIRTRKSLGAVTDLIPTLLDDPVYPDRAAAQAAFWVQMEDPDRRALQRSLLAAEGLTAPAASPHPSYDDLVDLARRPALRLCAGAAGRPDPLPVQRLRSEDDLPRCAAELVRTYDLDPALVRSLLRQALQAALEAHPPTPAEAARAEEILALFDRISGRAVFSDPTASPFDGGETVHDPRVWEACRRRLAESRIVIPADYDRDAVRGVFRVLDGALLSRLPFEPDLKPRLAQLLARTWPDMVRLAPLNWQALYALEKAANVFGRAASAGLQLLQQDIVLPMMLDPGNPGSAAVEALRLGETDPLTLRLLASPILAHGRYALQSPITVANSHPFLDQHGRRAIAINGVFDSEVEERLRRYLQQVCGLSFRTGNSAEYFALLWGHYFQQLATERARFETIRRQTDGDLAELGIGSQAIDYQAFKRLGRLSTQDLDEQAFIAAARQFTAQGGQIAVCGMSLASPQRLYVASHNRPLFLVRRPATGDVMVVSDVNAALGLFPQKLLHECRQAVHDIRRQAAGRIGDLLRDGAHPDRVREDRRAAEHREEECCRALAVEIHTLEGESRFARIATTVRHGRVERDIRVTDFDGQPPADIEPSSALLRPPQLQRHLHTAFFEAHLDEIPDRLEELLAAGTDGAGMPVLPLSRRTLERRFGAGLRNLKRVVLLGAGSSHHVALLSRGIFQRCLPDIEVAVLAPWEAEPLPRLVSPEGDLVVLVSWSGTTADMVECAKVLRGLGAVMVGVTEKPFADMPLIAAKSAGLVLARSGEEVTVSAVKAPPCLLFGLGLLAAWLAQARGAATRAGEAVARLAQLPLQMRALRADPRLEAFCQETAAAHRDADACLVIGALQDAGAGMEAALKLEETTWTAVARALDYSDTGDALDGLRRARTFVLVNATTLAHRAAALATMRRLQAAGVAFTALSYPCREKRQIAALSGGRNFLLPKIEDAYQPFLDLVAHYALALQFGRARGLSAGGFPRNRAKSVTVGRSRTVRIPSPSTAVAGMALSVAPEAREVDLSQPTAWESAASPREREAYEAIRRWASGPRTAVPPEAERLESAVFDELPGDGHLVFVPLDRAAEAACLSAIFHWNALLPCGVRLERASPSLARLAPRNRLLVCAGTPEGAARAPRLLKGCRAPWLGVGMPPPEGWQGLPGECLGGLACGTDAARPTRIPGLYMAISRLLATLWSRHSTVAGGVLATQLDDLPAVVAAVLGDRVLKEGLGQLAAENLRYRTASYIGPPGLTVAWEEIFGISGAPVLTGHPFGASAHGHLVTVDPRHGRKYVRLGDREAMAAAFGPETLAQWEVRYLGGATVAGFLASPVATPREGVPSAFFAEGEWFIPELRPDYNPAEDNLVILDATGRRALPLALDELATFGCRYARLAVLTQKAFAGLPDAGALYQQPVSHYLRLPALPPDGRALPDLLLPVALHLVGLAAAAAFAHLRHDV